MKVNTVTIEPDPGSREEHVQSSRKKTFIAPTPLAPRQLLCSLTLWLQHK